MTTFTPTSFRPAKRFRFDSFATEFAKETINEDLDNDSGIDTEENQISPLGRTSLDAPMRHWKKSMKDLASIKHEEVEEAENLCIRDQINKDHHHKVAADALLSLSRESSPVLPIPPPLVRKNSATVAINPFPTYSLPTKPVPKLPFSNVPVGLPNTLPLCLTPRQPFGVLSEVKSSNVIPVTSTPNGGLLRCIPTRDLTNQVQVQGINTTTSKPKKNSTKPFQCLECRKGFSTQSGYAKHQQLHCTNQIQKSFSCNYCNKGYTSLSALKMHIRTHTLPCKCETCGKSFSRPWLLQGHVRTHTGEKPFSCNYCSRSFADKSNLRAHLQTHLQTKKYSCQICQKTFSRMSLLNKHSDGGCPGSLGRGDENCMDIMPPLGMQIRA